MEITVKQIEKFVKVRNKSAFSSNLQFTANFHSHLKNKPMAFETYHIKIAGAGTRKDVVSALRTLADDLDCTPAEELNTSHTSYEDDTLMAEWFEL